jgi:phosphoglycolate phosphatase
VAVAAQGQRAEDRGVRSKMRKTGPVGFDLDLTLVNSRPAIMAAWSAVSAELGVQIDLAEVDQRMGIKLEEEVSYWFPADGHQNAADSYRRHYVRLAPTLTFPLAGAAESLAAVRQAGERAIIVTAKHQVSVQPSLDAVGLQADEIFTHVHGPEKAAVLAHVGAAVYIGDTPADMAAGQAAGALAVGVPTGSFTAEQLRAAGAAVVLRSLADFPPWYAGFRDDLTQERGADDH